MQRHQIMERATFVAVVGVGIRLHQSECRSRWCRWCIPAPAPPGSLQPTHHPHEPALRVCPHAKPQTTSQVQAHFSIGAFPLYMTFHSFGAPASRPPISATDPPTSCFDLWHSTANQKAIQGGKLQRPFGTFLSFAKISYFGSK